MKEKDNPEETKSPAVARAVALFTISDFNCAESVLLAATESLKKCTPSIPCVATAFGGGMGRKGSVCGALTGALMVLGVVHGRTKPSDDKEKIYGLTRTLYDDFVGKFGSPFCSELIECSLATPEGRDKYHKANLRDVKCKNYVAFCTERLAEMLAPLLSG